MISSRAHRGLPLRWASSADTPPPGRGSWAVHILTGGEGGGKLTGWNRATESDRAELARLARPELRFSFGLEVPPGTRILVAGFPSREQLLAAGPELQALLVPFAGLPAATRQLLLDQGWVARGLRVHNIHHNSPMTAELTVALALAAAKQLLPADRLLRSGDWSSRGIPADGDPDPLPQMLLEGSTALVLGYGAVGRRVARVMAALGAHVLATRRSAPAGGAPDGEDAVMVHPATELHGLLPRANLLLICTPETCETVGLLGAAEIEMLPPGSVLVNTARGAVVDEDALFEGLRSGHLLSAGIDVWYKYPADAGSRTSTPVSERHDFAALPNVLMSPHRAGAVGCAHTEVLRVRELARLCNAAVVGGLDAIPNRISLEAGY